VLVYRTGAYAPNGVPWANGYVDYLKLINARGGINGVKISFEECETGYATDKGVECYERLKGKTAAHGVPAAVHRHHLRADREGPGDKIPLITAGYGRSDSADGGVFKWNFPLMALLGGADVLVQHIAKKEGGWTSSRARRSRWSTTTARSARSRSRCCRNAARCTASSCSCCR
jgi:branched-chain amino acid transport system substrate-binding protein